MGTFRDCGSEIRRRRQKLVPDFQKTFLSNLLNACGFSGDCLFSKKSVGLSILMDDYLSCDTCGIHLFGMLKTDTGIETNYGYVRMNT